MKSMRLFNLFVIALFLFALVPAQSASAAPSPAVLAAPSLTAPSNALLPVDAGWRPTLKWKTVTGATSYEIQLATNSSYSALVYPTVGSVHNVGNVTEFQLDQDLPANKKIYWHVRTVNADGAGKWSSSRYFYTRPHPVTSGFYNGPMATVGDTVAALRPTFEWDAAENVTKYTINVATDNAFKSIKINKTFSVTAGTDPVTYTHTSDLAAGTTFYWRVLAYGAYAKSDWSTTQTFSTPTTPPSVPVQVSPLNKTVTVYNPDLTWKPATTYNSAAAEYQVQLSTSSKFATIYRTDIGITNTTFTVPEQLPAGTYYWRVRSVDDRGVMSNWSKVYYFKTPATVRIRVLDAAIHSIGNLEGLEGVTVQYTGVVDPMTTDADGYVTIRFAPTGSRKVSLSATDFLNYSKTQSISAGRFYDLTYDLKRRPIRLDLTWGKLPSDLDVHLWLPETFGYKFHLYPDNKGTTSKLPWAKIDKDSFGTATTKTERITIQDRFPGVYTFAVFNYYRDGKWETSGARVVFSKLDATGKVWTPMAPVTVLRSDVTSYLGKWWHVFNIDGATGEISGSIINTVQIESPGPYDQFGGTALEPK